MLQTHTLLALLFVLLALGHGLELRHYARDGRALTTAERHTWAGANVVSQQGYVLVLRHPAGVERDAIVANLLTAIAPADCYLASHADAISRAVLKLMCATPPVPALYPAALLAWVAQHGQFVHSLGVDELIVHPTASSVQYVDAQRWNLDRLDTRTRRYDGQYNYPASGGAGVTAYVLDTGIRTTHVEFQGRARFGFNAVGDGRQDDCDGHGTHVAGTLGSRGYGVAKAVELVAVRILDCDGAGSTFTVVTGLEYVLEQIGEAETRSRAVVNLSIGGSANSQVDAAIRQLSQRGAAVAVAAGNDGEDACAYSPARVASVLTVAASDDRDRLAPYSNLGLCVDIIAPGTSILSTAPDSNTALAFKSGTSMACPHVAGTLALVLGQDPAMSGVEAQAVVLGAVTQDVIYDATQGTRDTMPWALLYSNIDLSTPPPPPPPAPPGVLPPPPPPPRPPSLPGIQFPPNYFDSVPSEAHRHAHDEMPILVAISFLVCVFLI